MKKAIISFLFLALGIILASCTNSYDDADIDSPTTPVTSQSSGNPTSATKIKVVLAMPSARTVFPEYDPETLTDIKLSGKQVGTGTGSTDMHELKSWDTYVDFVADNGIVMDNGKISGTWNFELEANSLNCKMSATIAEITIAENTTTDVSFTLSAVPDSDNAGKRYGNVKITIDDSTEENKVSKSLTFEKVTAIWQDETEEVSLTKISSGDFEYSKTEVDWGNYLLTLKFYDSNDKVVYTYLTSVIVRGGATSKATFTNAQVSYAQGTLEVEIMIKYHNAEDDNVEAEPFKNTSLYGTLNTTESFNTIKTEITAPAGKKFRGWNTEPDGTGDRYSPGDQPEFTLAEVNLYAQWCTYDDTDEVFAIKDEADLRAFFSYNYDANHPGVEKGQSGNARLDTDADNITLENWEPPYYKGTFNGNNKTISGITMKNTTYDYAGFIGELDGGEIKNLKVTDSTIETNNTLWGYAGAIVGKANNAAITDCEAQDVTIKAPTAGGIVGDYYTENSSKTLSNLKVSYSSTEGKTCTITGSDLAGGIAGSISGKSDSSVKAQVSNITIEGITVTGQPDSGESAKAGGIAGTISYSTVSNIGVKTSTITSGKVKESNYAGGVAGYMLSSEITDSNSRVENVNVTSYEAGGFIGNASTITLSNCTAHSITIDGNIAGGIIGNANGCTITKGVVEMPYSSTDRNTITGAICAGGIVGKIVGKTEEETSKIEANSEVKKTDITVTESFGTAGGIAGESDSASISSVEIGLTNVTSVGSGSYAGGIVGYNKGSIKTRAEIYSSSKISNNSDSISCISKGETRYTSVGGIAGYNEGTISSAYMNGTVVGLGFYTGGIAGYNSGEIKGTEDEKITVSDSAQIKGGGRYTGGIAGYNSGKIEGTSSKKITVEKSNFEIEGKGQYTGGAVGENAEEGTIEYVTLSAKKSMDSQVILLLPLMLVALLVLILQQLKIVK